MSSSPDTSQLTQKPGKGSQSTGKRAPKRLNRSQQQAMEIRAAETRFMPVETPDTTEHIVATPVAATSMGAVAGARAARTATTSKRTASRPVIMTREEEYGYIAEDMRRLLITAAILLVFMLVVLFIVER